MLVKERKNHDRSIELVRAARGLREEVSRLAFGPPVAHVYNPLSYAWAPYEAYLRTYATNRKRVVFLGMNPGPFGMVQTGIPFGEVTAVRDWLRITGRVAPPASQHERRPITGFDCPRSEVSGQRLWGLFANRFGSPEAFFRDHLVLNYCPLAFLEGTGKNRTPDKLPSQEREALFAACDQFLQTAIGLLEPDWIIGVGDFALQRAEQVFSGETPKLGRILHPSPASPAANRGWAEAATVQMQRLGLWV
ncbi:MAG TPA: uracil-DNA glycosylase family protein [Clostridia bacterium]|nr:uracil-DNA glycosylase family protein [Clostridia bacterium]